MAVAIDLAFGEPHHVIHPVVWMGKTVSLLERGGSFQSPIAQFLYGLAMVLVILVLFTAPVYFILSYLKGLNIVVYLIAGAVLLKTTFSLKELRRAALKVRNLLQEDKPDKARFELRSLVSRDTRELPEPLLVSAAVESVAEGVCDSFIAPLFYLLFFGIPGAIAYRVVNTMDAMVGYHGKYEYLGKFASRLDDVLNFIPARLTALLLVLAAFMFRKNGRASWRIAITEHSRTESPNAGWPIAAIAGALNVQLEKVGQYRLGEKNNPLEPKTIDASLKLAETAMLAWVFLSLIAGVINFAITS